MTIQKFNIGEFVITDSALAGDGATLTVVASTKNRKGQDVDGDARYYEFPDLTITDFSATVNEKGGERVEVIGLASVVDAANDLSDGRKRYTLTIGKYDDDTTLWRGRKQDESGTNAIANYDEDLVVNNFPVGSTLKIAWDVSELKKLDNTFKSNTTQLDDVEAGEAFEVNDQLSLHADGYWYKYDSENYPEWRGTAAVVSTGPLEKVSVYLTGYIVEGYSSLITGGSVYADNVGETTQTATETAKFIGYALSEETVQLQTTAPSSEEKASEEEAREGTNDTKFMTPLTTVTSINENGANLFPVQLRGESSSDIAPRILTWDDSLVSGNYTLLRRVAGGKYDKTWTVTSPTVTLTDEDLLTGDVDYVVSGEYATGVPMPSNTKRFTGVSVAVPPGDYGDGSDGAYVGGDIPRGGVKQYTSFTLTGAMSFTGDGPSVVLVDGNMDVSATGVINIISSAKFDTVDQMEIGRASCRERV